MSRQGTDPVPLVIVEGFLGVAGPLLWGNVQEHSNHLSVLEENNVKREVLFARCVYLLPSRQIDIDVSNSVGPVSSLHDRACELYFALRRVQAQVSRFEALRSYLA